MKLSLGPGIGEVGFDPDVVAFHDSLELQADVIGLDEVAFGEVVLPCPLVIIDICGEWN